MSEFTIPLTGLIHENLSVVMTYAYSQPRLSELLRTRFLGGWKYLHKSLVEISGQRAERAVLELALFVRHLDDDERLSHYYAQIKEPSRGELFMRDGSVKPLTFRQASNKILHARRLEWDFADHENPKLTCYSRDGEKWERAAIDIVAFAAFCGGLMS